MIQTWGEVVFFSKIVSKSASFPQRPLLSPFADEQTMFNGKTEDQGTGEILINLQWNLLDMIWINLSEK